MYLVLDGVRAELPAEMTEDVKILIRRCWAEDPVARPSFSDILAELERIQFKIFPDVDSRAVALYLDQVRSEADRK
jgi:hypothetical protein